MRNRDEPKASVAQPWMALNPLLVQAFVGTQPSFIKHLRSELTEPRVETPGLLQEQPSIGSDRFGPTENVLQRRNIRTVGMASFQRLLKLLRIAEKYKALGRLGNGENVGQRHLPSFVNKENINGLKVLFLCPEPLCAGQDIGAVQESCKGLLIVNRGQNMRWIMLRLVLLPDFLDSSQIWDTSFYGRRDSISQQLANDLVACRRDADPLALTHKFADHARPGEGLSGTRRPLNCQNRAVEHRSQALGGYNGSLARQDERCVSIRESGRAAQQQISCRSVRSVRIYSIRVNPGADAVDRFCQNVRAGSDIFDIRCEWMDLRRFLRLLDVNGSHRNIDAYDLAKLLTFETQFIAGANVSLLFLECIAVGRNISLNPKPFYKMQPGQSRFLIEQIFIGKLTEAVEFPPFRLKFSAMPIQKVRKQPTRGFFVTSLLWVVRNASLQPSG